jgi:hypothetical protein
MASYDDNLTVPMAHHENNNGEPPEKKRRLEMVPEVPEDQRLQEFIRNIALSSGYVQIKQEQPNQELQRTSRLSCSKESLMQRTIGLSSSRKMQGTSGLRNSILINSILAHSMNSRRKLMNRPQRLRCLNRRMRNFRRSCMLPSGSF